MPRLPPVPISPQTRLRARLPCGVIGSVVTFFQSHSSSSATSWARPVNVPWPISERAMRITQVSSGLTTTQALTSAPAARFCASAVATPNGRLNPSANPPPAAVAVPMMKLRRESLRGLLLIVFFMADLPELRLGPAGGAVGGAPSGASPVAIARRHVHGRADALIGAASTDVCHRL